MTEDQRAKLPGMMREIVDADRGLSALRKEAVIDFKGFNELKDTAKRLRDAAASTYGTAHRGGDKVTS